jgi:hypothetical protein
MSFAFNGIKEEAKCVGTFCLNQNRCQHIINKYIISNDNYKFLEIKNGIYYIFRTPDNLLYLIDEIALSTTIISSTKQIMDVTKLKENNIYNIIASNYNGLIQYKKLIDGQYYVFTNQKTPEKIILISGNDIDILDENEKKKLLELTFSIK